MDIPANMLSGKSLNNDWVVGEKITKQKGKTGGHFSVCYKIQNKDGQKAFLKVADFSSAFKADDPPRALQAMLESYNFERDLLEKCKRLKRIITAIEDGKIFICSNPQFNQTAQSINFLYSIGFFILSPK